MDLLDRRVLFYMIVPLYVFHTFYLSWIKTVFKEAIDYMVLSLGNPQYLHRSNLTSILRRLLLTMITK